MLDHGHVALQLRHPTTHQEVYNPLLLPDLPKLGTGGEPLSERSALGPSERRLLPPGHQDIQLPGLPIAASVQPGLRGLAEVATQLQVHHNQIQEEDKISNISGEPFNL